MNVNENYENLAKLLHQLPKQSVTADFDKRFWQAFETHVPLAAAPAAGIPAFAFAGVGVVAVAMIAAVTLTHIVDIPKITVTQGDVSYKTVDVKQNDKIVTAPTSWAIIELENGYRVKIEPDSQVEIKSLKPKYLPGDRIYLFSDGLYEAKKKDGEEYGLTRLKGFLDMMKHFPFKEAVKRFIGEAEHWAYPDPLHDDASIVAIEIDKSGVI
jgi:hypothetical protein